MIDDTRENGWVGVRRNLLAHMEDGRLSINEYAVFTVLLLSASSKTGEVKTSPKSVLNLMGNFIKYNAMQELFRRLEVKGYITRSLPKGHRGIYAITISNYEISQGEFKGVRTKSGAVNPPKNDENRPTHGPLLDQPGDQPTSQPMDQPTSQPTEGQQVLESTDTYDGPEGTKPTHKPTHGPLLDQPRDHCSANPWTNPIQEGEAEGDLKTKPDLIWSGLVPSAGEPEGEPVQDVPAPVKTNVPLSLNLLAGRNNPTPRSAKPFAPTQPAQESGPQYSDDAHELAEFWAKMEGSYDTANLEFYAKCCEIALETIPDPNDLRKLMKFAWENDSYIREECDVPIAVFKMEKKLRETAYKFGRSQTKESKAASVEHLSWVKAGKEGFDEEEA